MVFVLTLLSVLQAAVNALLKRHNARVTCADERLHCREHNEMEVDKRSYLEQ